MEHFDREVPRDQNTLIKPMENEPFLITRYLAIKIPYETNRKWTIFDREVHPLMWSPRREGKEQAGHPAIKILYITNGTRNIFRPNPIIVSLSIELTIASDPEPQIAKPRASI